jgi:gag-polypeptide of LTR copia-type/Pol polyprotein, beta-barrel domain/Zinc knuckle
MSPAGVMASTFSLSSSQSISIPHLLDDSLNWIEYKTKARTAMGSKGLIRHVEGKAITPTPFALVDGKPMVDDKTPATRSDIRDLEKDVDESEQKKQLTRHIILSTVSPRLMNLIKDKTEPKEMWDLVKADASPKTEIHKIDTLTQINKKKCANGDNIKTHLTELLELRDKLIGMGGKIEDDYFCTIVLVSLPATYRSFIASITISASLSDKVLPTTDLIRMIGDEYNFRMISLQTTASMTSALSAQGVKKRGNNSRCSPRNESTSANAADSSTSKKRIKCFNCDKPGHYKSECWAPGGGKEGQGPKQKASKASGSSASVAAMTESQQYAFASAINPSLTAPVLIDSGASSHFCPDRAKFSSICPAKSSITLANGSVCEGLGKGIVLIDLPNGQTTTRVTLCDTIYTPAMTSTLISILKLNEAGFTAEFGSRRCKIIAPNSAVIAELPVASGLYRCAAAVTKSTPILTLYKAHRMLGHTLYQKIKDIVKGGKLTSMNVDLSSEEPFCNVCAQSKPTQQPFPTEASNQSKTFSKRIHADLWGEAQVYSLGGALYSVDLHDDATRYTHIEFLETKDQAFDAYKTLDKALETQFGTRIKILHTDRGGEGVSSLTAVRRRSKIAERGGMKRICEGRGQ